MSFLDTIILAVVQGISEWLPISSSGHLVLFQKWLDIADASLEFDVFLHLASLFVVLIYFRKEIREVLNSSFLPKGFPNPERRKWFWMLFISTIITAGIGYYFYDQIDIFRRTSVVAQWLMVTSVLLFGSKFGKENKNISLSIAIVLGIVQGFAVIPGLSRAGSVIATALILGVNKRDAFDYAFLMAIPAIGGAFLLSLKNFAFEPIYIVPFFVTILVGYLSLILLKKILVKNYFYLFFVYTTFVGLMISKIF